MELALNAPEELLTLFRAIFIPLAERVLDFIDHALHSAGTMLSNHPIRLGFQHFVAASWRLLGPVELHCSSQPQALDSC